MADRTLISRMIGAATFDLETFEEVEANESLTGQAALVVFLAAIAEAIGSSRSGLIAAVGAGIAAIFAWLLWAGITYLIGDKMLGGTATWGELLRTLGFAQAPGVFLVLAIIPLLGWAVQAGVALWMLGLGVIAVRQALDFSTGKAIATVLVGWICLTILHAIF